MKKEILYTYVRPENKKFISTLAKKKNTTKSDILDNLISKLRGKTNASKSK